MEKNIDKCNIAFKLDNTVFSTGDKILGELHLQLNQQILMKGIKIIYNVQEYIQHTPQKETFESNKSLFERTLILKPYDQLEPGQYSFDFSFPIPDFVPGSFEYYNPPTSIFILHYLNAEILTDAFKESIFCNNLIIVKEKPLINLPSTILSDKAEIKNFFLSKKGSCTLNLNYHFNNYKAGSFINIDGEIDNSLCSVKVGRISLTLYQEISFMICSLPFKFRTKINEYISDEMCVKIKILYLF